MIKRMIKGPSDRIDAKASKGLQDSRRIKAHPTNNRMPRRSAPGPLPHEVEVGHQHRSPLAEPHVVVAVVTVDQLAGQPSDQPGPGRRARRQAPVRSPHAGVHAA
jgi:hypothetical protein